MRAADGDLAAHGRRLRSTRSPTIVAERPARDEHERGEPPAPALLPGALGGEEEQDEEADAVDRAEDRDGRVAAVGEREVQEHDEQQRVGDADGEHAVERLALARGVVGTGTGAVEVIAAQGTARRVDARRDATGTASEPSLTSSVPTVPLRSLDAVTAFVSIFGPVTAW